MKDTLYSSQRTVRTNQGFLESGKCLHSWELMKHSNMPLPLLFWSTTHWFFIGWWLQGIYSLSKFHLYHFLNFMKMSINKKKLILEGWNVIWNNRLKTTLQKTLKNGKHITSKCKGRKGRLKGRLCPQELTKGYIWPHIRRLVLIRIQYQTLARDGNH